MKPVGDVYHARGQARRSRSASTSWPAGQPRRAEEIEGEEPQWWSVGLELHHAEPIGIISQTVIVEGNRGT
jgi:hypothetical protein